MKDERNATTIVEEFYKNFLHGELVIQIMKAERLTNTDHGIKLYGLHNIGTCISVKRAFTFSKNLADPYVSIYLGDSCLCRTSCKSDKYATMNNYRFKTMLSLQNMYADTVTLDLMLNISICSNTFHSLNPTWNEKFTVSVCHNEKR